MISLYLASLTFDDKTRAEVVIVEAGIEVFAGSRGADDEQTRRLICLLMRGVIRSIFEAG